MTQQFAFQLLAKDGAARRGLVSTPRGDIRTPAFMPVGTAATVKAMFPQDVRATGADIVLGNVYHLMLRPGAERVAALGGLHEFMNWPHPILTDSGGFQVMSLSKLRKLDEQGVAFQSHIDGSRHMLDARALDGDSAPARFRHSHAIRRMRAPALHGGGGRARHAPVAALGGALAQGFRRRRRQSDLRNCAGRRVPAAAHRERARRSRPWISTVSP